MLLAKTIRSTTFRLALLCIAIFGAIVVALIGYIYVSASSLQHAGATADAFDAFAQRIETALILALLLIFVLAVVASVSVTRRTVGRIEAINATSRAIVRAGLGERMPLRGAHDEWEELAANLNAMLDRIETLVQEVRQVTDNLAHDLRTPLAHIRRRLEKASHARRADDADQQLIADTLADLDAVLRMFASLLRISQIEAYDRTSGFRRVDLVLVASEVVELFDAAAEENGARLEMTAVPHAYVQGDRDLLFESLSNLVDNAIKHGRSGGRVIVEVSERGGAAILSVEDDGPGISRDERQHVFKRFYRLERSRRMPGNGLGLSLVASVASLHGAHVEVLDAAPGLKLELLFPVDGASTCGSSAAQGRRAVASN